MKKIFTTAIGLLVLSFGAMAQDDVSDEFSIDEPDTNPEAIIVDTLSTADRFTKMVVFSDSTHQFIDLGHPQFGDDEFEAYDGFSEGWNNESIHAYRDMDVKDLPDDVLLSLVDSLHSFCPPIVGNVRSTFHFRKRRPHKGTDIPLHVGDTVRAAFDGKVRIVMGTKRTGGYGNLVVIRHANGLETYYGHLSKHAVAVNDYVKAGDVIGFGGNTGRSTGPHLHFEARFMGKAFDPERIIDFANGKLRTDEFTVRKHYFSIYSHYGQTDAESLQASKSIMHKIRGGDTLGALARKYGTTVSAICKMNGFKQNKVLRVGQFVRVR